MLDAIFQEVYPSIGSSGQPFYVEGVVDPSPRRVERTVNDKDLPPLIGEGTMSPSRISINTHRHFYVFLLLN